MSNRKSQFKKHTVELDENESITFYHNLPDTFGMNIDGAVNNWILRTDRYDVKSLANYVESKGVGHQIITEEEYNKLPD